MNKIPRQRLHPSDLYHMIDWLRDGWDDGWHETATRLARLEWHLLELPQSFHERARAELDVLGRAMIVEGVDRDPAFRNLRRLISEWGKTLRVAA